MHFPMRINQIELLNGLNYKKWKRDIELNLEILDFDHVLKEEATLEPDDQWKEVKDKYLQGYKHNKMSLILVKKSMTDAVKGGLPDSGYAKDYFNFIAEKYKVSDKAEIDPLMNKLVWMKFNGQGSIREYIMKGIDTAGKLKGLNMIIEDSFLVYLLLNALHNQYSHLKSLYNTQKEKCILNELISICVQEEVEVLKKGKAVDVNYVGKSTCKKNFGKCSKGGTSGTSKNSVKSDINKGKSHTIATQLKCFFCKKVVHFKDK